MSQELNETNDWTVNFGSIELDKNTYKYAIEGGRIDMLTWLKNNKCQYSYEFIDKDKDAYELAMKHNKLTVVVWLNGNWSRADLDTCDLAVKYERYHIINWLKLNRCPNFNICNSAAKYGKLDVLGWAVNNNLSQVNVWTTYFAAEFGHLHVLKWLHDRAQKFDSWVTFYAAKNNHLEVLKWSRTVGTDWNPAVCVVAARLGHFELLKWAMNNGCPYDKQKCEDAARENFNIEILKWIQNYVPNNNKVVTVQSDILTPNDEVIFKSVATKESRTTIEIINNIESMLTQIQNELKK